MRAPDEITTGDWSVLALVAERPVHGWALAQQLARGGEIGSICSLGRPLVYQSLERLERVGHLESVGIERGERGPHRVIYGATTQGKKAVRAWLAKPVEHVRDIRTLFVLKVVLSQRASIDIERLLVGQRATVVPFVAWLEAQLDDIDPAGRPSEATMLLFRLETAQSVVRFIDRLLDRPAPERSSKRQPAPRSS